MSQQKTNRYLRVTLALILCASVFSAYGASGKPPSYEGEGFRHMSRGFGPHRIFKLLHKLDISREQLAAIGQIMDDHRPVMREFIFDMMDGRKALHSILASPDYDPKRIEELALSQAQNAEQMFLATAETFAEISALLTGEQRQELAKMIEERGHWRREHREAT